MRTDGRPNSLPQFPGREKTGRRAETQEEFGFRSVAAFINQNAAAGVEIAFAMSIIAISIAGGLLAANAIVPSRRRL